MDDASDGGGGHHFDRTGALTLRRSPGFITLELRTDERAIEFRMSHGNAAIVGRELISAALLAASEARS